MNYTKQLCPLVVVFYHFPCLLSTFIFPEKLVTHHFGGVKCSLGGTSCQIQQTVQTYFVSVIASCKTCCLWLNTPHTTKVRSILMLVLFGNNECQTAH